MAQNKKLYQFIALTKEHFKTYFGIGLSVFLFVLFYQPFEVRNFEFEDKLLFDAGFGLTVIVLLFVIQIVFQAFLVRTEKDYEDISLLTPLYFFSQVGITTLGFIFYIRYVGQGLISFNVVAKVIFICLSLPVTIYLKNKLSSYQCRLKTLQNETLSLREKLNQLSESSANKFIEIVSEGDSDNFRAQVSEIVFVKSADNYVEIAYNDEGVVKKTMIRNTLKNLELQLNEFNNFIRTHRTSLVNIQYINKLHKSFNTYWLSIDNTNDTIPVSRQYLLSVKGLL